MDFFDELKFEGIGEDKDAFLGLFRNDDGTYREDEKEALLGLAFAKEGKVDSLGDDTYLEINGERLYLPHSGHDEKEITNFCIEKLDVSSVSFDLNETEGTLSIDVEDLTFTAKIAAASVEHSIEIKLSASALLPVEKYKENDTDPGRWVYSYEGLQSLDVTMDGDKWPHFEFEPMKTLVRYGDYERYLGYTLSFDPQGGSPVLSIRVPFGETISSDDLPKTTKQGFVFMGWVTEDDELINEYGIDVEKDMTLRAAYYTPAPSSLEGEIYATYKLADYFSLIERGGVDIFGNFFEYGVNANEAFLDIAFLVNGKTNGFGGEAVITIGDEEYSSARVKSELVYEISNGTLVSKGGSNSLKSKTDDEVIGKFRYFDGLSYTVTIKDKITGSVEKELKVSLYTGNVNVKPCDDPAKLEVFVAIGDTLDDSELNSVQLVGGGSNGYYGNKDGYYFFDSTKYPEITLKK